MPPFFGASRKVREANKGLGEAPESCTRKEHESTTNSIAKRGQGAIAPCRVKGQRPLWGLGQRPNCSASNLLKGRSQQGAGSEASLPVTLRVRRRAPKLLFPQDSVKNPFFGADFLAKETHLICCISWMRCVLWLDFSMWICLCTAGGEGVEGAIAKPPPRARRREIPASTRGSSLKVSPTQSRERVKGGGTSSRFIRPVSFSLVIAASGRRP